MTIDEIISNNYKISVLLAINENLYRTITDGSTIKDKRLLINIPNGYISKVEDIITKYHLNEIIRDDTVKRNMSYLLQQQDLSRFIYSRFNIWGSVEIMTFKIAQIVYASFIETLIVEAAKEIWKKCKDCPYKPQDCNQYIDKKDAKNMKVALGKLSEIGAITLDDKTCQRIIKLYDSRNKIHISLTHKIGNEYTNEMYSHEDCNDSIELISLVADDLLNHAVPLYDDLSCCYKHI